MKKGIAMEVLKNIFLLNAVGNSQVRKNENVKKIPVSALGTTIGFKSCVKDLRI